MRDLGHFGLFLAVWKRKPEWLWISTSEAETAGLAQREFRGKSLKSLLIIQVLPIFLFLHSSMWAFICMLVVLMVARWLLYLLASHLNSRPAEEWREGQAACLLRQLFFFFFSLLCSLWDLNFWVGTETGSSAEESRSPSCQSTREFPKAVCFKMLSRVSHSTSDCTELGHRTCLTQGSHVMTWQAGG